MIIAVAKHLTTGSSVLGTGAVQHVITAETSDWMEVTAHHRRYTHKQYIAARQRGKSLEHGMPYGCLALMRSDAAKVIICA